MESKVTRALRLPRWHTATTSWLRRSKPVSATALPINRTCLNRLTAGGNSLMLRAKSIHGSWAERLCWHPLTRHNTDACRGCPPRRHSATVSAIGCAGPLPGHTRWPI
jgi:hypothetical protein